MQVMIQNHFPYRGHGASRNVCLIALTLLLPPAFAWAGQENQSEKRTVFVRSGLSIKDAPSPDATEIALIPFGTKLEVQRGTSQPTHTIDGIRGEFVRVQLRDVNGFAFNGHLSQFSAATADVATVQDYFKNALGPAKEGPKIRPNVSSSPFARSEVLLLSDGIKMREDFYEAGGTSVWISLPAKYELHEALLLFRAYEPVFAKAEFSPDPMGKSGIFGRIYLTQNPDMFDPYIWFWIYREEDRLIIQRGPR